MKAFSQVVSSEPSVDCSRGVAAAGGFPSTPENPAARATGRSLSTDICRKRCLMTTVLLLAALLLSNTQTTLSMSLRSSTSSIVQNDTEVIPATTETYFLSDSDESYIDEGSANWTMEYETRAKRTIRRRFWKPCKKMVQARCSDAGCNVSAQLRYKNWCRRMMASFRRAGS